MFLFKYHIMYIQYIRICIERERERDKTESGQGQRLTEEMTVHIILKLRQLFQKEFVLNANTVYQNK